MAITQAIIGGSDNYIHLWAESTWGTKPGSPALIYMPVTNYGVAMTKNSRETKPHYGQFGKAGVFHVTGQPAGQITGELCGVEPSSSATSLAKTILDWVFGGEADTFLPSKGIEFAQGPDIANQQHDGLRVNTFTLAGAEGGAVTWTLDVMGTTDTAVTTANTISADLKGFPGFEFSDCVLTIGGTAIDIADFSLQRQHGLKVKYLGGTTPKVIAKSMRNTTFQFKIVKQAAAYDVIRRTIGTETDSALVLTMNGKHGGTGASGTYTTIAFTMPKSRLLMPGDAHSFEDITMTDLPYACLIPDGGGAEITIAYSLT